MEIEYRDLIFARQVTETGKRPGCTGDCLDKPRGACSGQYRGSRCSAKTKRKEAFSRATERRTFGAETIESENTPEKVTVA